MIDRWNCQQQLTLCMYYSICSVLCTFNIKIDLLDELRFANMLLFFRSLHPLTYKSSCCLVVILMKLSTLCLLL